MPRLLNRPLQQARVNGHAGGIGGRRGHYTESPLVLDEVGVVVGLRSGDLVDGSPRSRRLMGVGP